MGDERTVKKIVESKPSYKKEVDESDIVEDEVLRRDRSIDLREKM